MKAAIGWLIGLVFVVSASAEPLFEGRVRLESGEPVADAQVRLFDLTDLRQGAIARALTDGTGYFALPLAALGGQALPQGFTLGPNYPNPFNPSTIIPYQLAASAAVRLEVFNLLGQRITMLVDGERAAGFHTATWHATDGSGRAVGAGVYIYRMTVGVESQTGRMVLIDGQAGVSAAGAASVMPGVSGVGGSNEADAQVYGLIVSGRGLVPYVDSSFGVESGMAPVELVVSSGQHSAGKVTDDDCAFCDLFGAFNDAEDDDAEEEETQEEEAETDSTSSEGGPDLIVQSPSVSAVTLTPGQEFTLNATVQNQGDEQAAATMLHYYRSNNATITSSDTEVGTDEIGVLDASATSAASITLTAPTSVSAEVGIYYGACVASVRGESNTDNNCSTSVRVIVVEDEDDAQGDHTPDASDISTDSIQDDALSSPPPTWVFAGDVPDADRIALREEMEAVRSWFADQYGVEATGFTVLVGADHEALAPVSRDVVGVDLSSVFVPPGHGGPNSLLPAPFVTTTNDGSSLMVFVYGRNPFDSLKDAIAHEYFHVLQNQLAPRYQTSEVKPYWLVEGLAQYADYAYSQSRLGRRPFFDRYSPYKDLGDAINLKGIMTPGELERLAALATFRDGCSLHPIYVYAMAFAGSYFLVEQTEEDSYVQYWKLLHDRPTWQQAFEESFGIGIEGFYEAFEEWLPAHLPSAVQISVWLRWPGKEALSRAVLSLLRWNTKVEPDIVTFPPSTGYLRWGGSTENGTHTIESPAGELWTTYLSLWWQSDECTDHLLGWYKDGELTDQRAEATLVEFTGESSSLEWILPARPDMLPRLSKRTLGHCTP